MSESVNGSISWSDRLEKYFKDCGERAEGLAWIHRKAEQIYARKRTFIDLPVIIGSGIIAFLNAGSSSMFANEAQKSSIALGIGSLIVGIINTLGTYYNFAKRAEGHRISAIQYSRLYRFLAIEMSLPREERMTPHDLLKYCKDTYDRLQEVSPLIPDSVEAQYRKQFGSQKQIAHPEEVNGINELQIYKECNVPIIQSPSTSSVPVGMEIETHP